MKDFHNNKKKLSRFGWNYQWDTQFLF